MVSFHSFFSSVTSRRSYYLFNARQKYCFMRLRSSVLQPLPPATVPTNPSLNQHYLASISKSPGSKQENRKQEERVETVSKWRYEET